MYILMYVCVCCVCVCVCCVCVCVGVCGCVWVGVGGCGCGCGCECMCIQYMSNVCTDVQFVATSNHLPSINVQNAALLSPNKDEQLSVTLPSFVLLVTG